MADISKEIQDFQTAVYGEEVRGSMISLAKKLNAEMGQYAEEMQAAIKNANSSASDADSASESAKNAAQEAMNAAAEAEKGKIDAIKAASDANKAAVNANGVTKEVQRMLDAGELTGPPGPRGEKGEQGESGIMAVSSGMFALELDPATGNLYAVYPDGEIPPQFEYDTATGNLYYVIAD